MKKSVYDLDDNVTFEESQYKYCLVTITSNLFAQGTCVLLNSFLQNNPWFNGDIKILYEPNYSSLNQQNMDLIQSNINYELNFKQINYDSYQDLITRANQKPDFKTRLNASFYTLEILKIIRNYDKLLYLDSDIVVDGDLQCVFNLDYPVVATPAGGGVKNIRIKKTKTFNGAFLMLNNNENINFNKIFNQMINIKNLDKVGYITADQPILNWFLWEYVYLIHKRFNAGKRIIKDSRFKKNYINLDKPIKVIHFPGEKPWFKNRKENMGCKKAEKIWHQYYDLG